MKKIHLNRAGQTLGIFNEEDIRTGLANGTFLPTDLAWYEGMPTWQPLRELSEFAPPAPTAPEPGAPVSPLRLERDPHQTPPPQGIPAPLTASHETIMPDQDEPAWERKESLGFFPALIETIKQVLLKPSETFERMKQTGGLMTPLIFLLIPGWVGAVAAVLYNGVLSAMSGEGGDQTFPMIAGFAGMLFLAPIFLALGAFIGAGIMHLCLMLVGGANKPFETTFRVFCYGSGSTAILQVIPICGGMIGGIWNLVVSIIGLQKAHNTTVGKAVLAIFLPMIVCCGLAIVIFLAFGGMAMLAGIKDGLPQ